VPLPLGRTNNLRSMIALENLVDFTALCADIEASPNASGQVFLISDGEDVSTSELIHRLAKAYDCNNCMFSVSPKIFRLVARLIGKSASVDRLLGSLVIDGSKARWMLGWHPIVSLDEQLKRIALQDHQI